MEIFISLFYYIEQVHSTKQKMTIIKWSFFCGCRDGEIRTHDLLLPKQAF